LEKRLCKALHSQIYLPQQPNYDSYYRKQFPSSAIIFDLRLINTTRLNAGAGCLHPAAIDTSLTHTAHEYQFTALGSD
jgi:hypothetical protein